MASWITVYCSSSLAKLTPKQLLTGITDGDPAATAGVDYLTLAESYDVDEEVAEAGEEALAVSREGNGFDTYLVTYGANRTVFVRRWPEPDRVKAELAEALDRKPPAKVRKRLAKTVEVIGIELAASQLSDFGIVVAYEVARYLAQTGGGIIRDLQNGWTAVVDGGFEAV